MLVVVVVASQVNGLKVSSSANFPTKTKFEPT
jgi:hypothetical protein